MDHERATPYRREELVASPSADSRKGLKRRTLYGMQPPFPWMGGKRRLASQILPEFPEHTCYVEVFGGAAALLFLREERAKAEVYNDIDGDLVTFFRVVQRHPEAFLSCFELALASRNEFERLKRTPPETLTDVERAARFFYLQKLCFGARSVNRTFGTATTGKARLRTEAVMQAIEKTHERLQGVVIEHLDWRECLSRYDRPHTLFYLDPPYFGVAHYGTPWELSEYEALAGEMTKLSGIAILSINDHTEMRRVFGNFEHQELSVRYTVGKKRVATTELLVKARS